MTRVYEQNETDLWSRYATDLYTRIHAKAERERWAYKLRYLLYEKNITPADAPAFCTLSGVLLQSKTGDDGSSKNPKFAGFQAVKSQHDDYSRRVSGLVADCDPRIDISPS